MPVCFLIKKVNLIDKKSPKFVLTDKEPYLETALSIGEKLTVGQTLIGDRWF